MMDLIDRQAAIDGLDKHYVERKHLNEWQEGWNEAIEWVATVYITELPPVQPEPKFDEWCTDCKEYDHDSNCCPRFNRVIREALKDAQPEIIYCKDCKNKRIYRFPPSYDEKHYCEKHEKVTKLDNYCSWAERRTNE